MKLALAQINPTVGDFAGNARLIRDFTARAAMQSADLVIFPELAVCGYPPADLLEKSSFLARSQQTLEDLAASTTNGPSILGGAALPISGPEDQSVGKRARNAAALRLSWRGRITFTQQKMLLPFYDVFDEQRYFEPATHQTLTLCDGCPLAITVCEDAWNDKGFWPRRSLSRRPRRRTHAPVGHPSPDLVAVHPRLILNISASPYWAGKRALRRDMLAAIARRHSAFVVMVNQVGGNDSLVFDGSSFVLSPTGEVLAQAASFAEDLVLIDLDVAASAHGASSPGALFIARCQSRDGWGTSLFGRARRRRLAHPDSHPLRSCPRRRGCLLRARPRHARLCAQVRLLPCPGRALRGSRLRPRRRHRCRRPRRGERPRRRHAQRVLLHRLHRRRPARSPHNLGIGFELVAINEIFTYYQAALAPLFAGTPFGLAEENLQSRIRGALLMALSNKFGSLVLTTGNKSEMSTGYCTLYGDMVGALAVIGDVFKTRVYALAHFVNRDREIIPHSTIAKPPSAELRPNQRGTDSLPPYELLDPILDSLRRALPLRRTNPRRTRRIPARRSRERTGQGTHYPRPHPPRSLSRRALRV